MTLTDLHKWFEPDPIHNNNLDFEWVHLSESRATGNVSSRAQLHLTNKNIQLEE